MSASPGPAADTPPSSLTQWLRGRDDRQLGRLLQLRPDLALPAPPDLAALAARVVVRTSTQRAVDGLDAPTLRVLEQLVLAAGRDDTVGLDGIDADALATLLELALVWDSAGTGHLTGTVRDAVGPYPAGLGRPAAVLFAHPAHRRPHLQGISNVSDPAWLADELASLDAEERDVLERLAAGPPVGTVRGGLAEAGGALTPTQRLLRHGLLVAIDTQRVELPREVGLAVRARDDERGDGVRAGVHPPALELVERRPDELDGLGTTAVLELLRLVELLIESWQAHPPSLLRSGGVGVRDLKRTAKDMGVDEPTAALVAETLFAASLVNATGGPEPVFLPTADYDSWQARGSAERWTTLGAAWLSMTRQPSLVNQRGDRDRVITALGPDAERGTLPVLRRQVLDQLALLAPGAAPAVRDEILARFAWQQPRRATAQRPLVEAILTEADLLGVTAAGGLTGYTRTLLAGSATAAGHALDRALPAPVEHFLVQPDLTVVVPGPPLPAMGRELGLLADLESTGGASVYRITEGSVRRALDAGRSADGLAAFVTAHSRTPVPQALSYLIDDAARRHGVLRAGAAGTYLRCSDEALLARVVADRGTAALDLRLIAPTVVISDAAVTRVLEVLRTAGFAPAAETPDGTLITLGVEQPRAPGRPVARRAVVRGGADTDAQAAELVRRLRSGDALAGLDDRVHPIARDIPGVTSAATMQLLRDAVREARLVWFGCAEANGTQTAHTMQPISLAAGTLRGYERGRPGLASYPVHRITAIRVLDETTDETFDGVRDD